MASRDVDPSGSITSLVSRPTCTPRDCFKYQPTITPFLRWGRGSSLSAIEKRRKTSIKMILPKEPCRRLLAAKAQIDARERVESPYHCPLACAKKNALREDYCVHGVKRCAACCRASNYEQRRSYNAAYPAKPLKQALEGTGRQLSET